MNDEALAKAVTTYEPNAQVVSKLGDIKMVATIGPSASGKTTVSKKLAKMDKNVHFILGETSRLPRPGEVQGIDYLFRPRQDILEDLNNGELVDVIVGPNDDLYSTRISSFEPSALNVMALIPLGIKKFRMLPLAFFSAAFIVPESYELWQEWLSTQADASGWGADKKKQRLEEGLESYKFALADPAVKFVLNDDPARAAERLAQVGQGQTPDDEAEARQIAVSNLQKLERAL